MDAKQIEEILVKELTLDEVHVTGENAHFTVIAVSDEFAQMSRVKQQQSIYAPLMSYISTNEIHALVIKTFTNEKWQRERVFNVVS